MKTKICLFKLVSGEEVLARCRSHLSYGYFADYPVMLRTIIGENGTPSVQMYPWMVALANEYQRDILISFENIVLAMEDRDAIDPILLEAYEVRLARLEGRANP